MLNNAIALYAPQIATPINSYESIATVTVGGSAVSSITLSSIPSTYTHLQIRAFFQTTRATYNVDDLDMVINGVTTGGTYARHGLDANIQNNGAVDAFGNASTNLMVYMATGTSTVATNCFGAAVIDILDYKNTNKYKTVRSLSGGDANGGASGYYPTVAMRSGLWMNTAAVTSITFSGSFGSSSLAPKTTFALYGIKG